MWGFENLCWGYGVVWGYDVMMEYFDKKGKGGWVLLSRPVRGAFSGWFAVLFLLGGRYNW